MEGRFTEEELAIAKSVDLCAVAESLGYTVKRIGKYHTLKEMDSIRIYDRSHWYRWSRQFDKRISSSRSDSVKGNGVVDFFILGSFVGRPFLLSTNPLYPCNLYLCTHR